MTKPVPFGKYLLLERLNAGGMAEVFLAKVFGPGGEARTVAVKRILPTLLSDREFVGMFLDEARVAAQLDHRNLVQIFELGRQGDNYYIAMEYLSGCDLRTAIDRARKREVPFALDQILYLIGELAAGLDHAHRAQSHTGENLCVVHRDVSPQNVLLLRDGKVKLIDFGIAKVATRQNATQVGILKGKFGYMSPEQARGLPIDRRSDIFSLGILFHELLCRRRLFTADSEFAVLERVRNADVRSPRAIDPSIPEEVERIVLKMLALEPSGRYDWASELVEDLHNLRGRPSNGTDAEALAEWMGRALAPELDQERERLRAYARLPRPPELEAVSLDTFAGALAARDPTGTLTLGSGEFELARTTLLTGLPIPGQSPISDGFLSGPTTTDVFAMPEASSAAGPETAPGVVSVAPAAAAFAPPPTDRWEAATQPPRPMHLFVAESPPPREAALAERLSPRALPSNRAPRIALLAGLGLVVAVALAALAVSLQHRHAATGAIAVSTRPAAGVQVEIDHRPLPLGPDGNGMAANLSPGSHFLLAQSPLGHRALRVTVVANEVASVDLTFVDSDHPALAPTEP